MSDLTQRIASLSPEKRALLMRQLQEKQAATAKEQAISKRDNLAVFPMSFAQQRLWFLDQYEPESSFYNVPAALRLTGTLDVEALKRSLNEVVRRHEVLRARFVTEKGHPVQVVAPELIVSLPVTDLQHLREEEREAEAVRLATEEAQRPFDLRGGPLVRASLLKLSDEEHVALLTMHHIVSDGWSVGILIREIATLYQALSAGKPSPLPQLRIQYFDFAYWQREWLQGDVLDAQLTYWKQQLGDIPPVLELPTDWPRPALQTLNGAHYTFKLSSELSKELKVLSREEGATLFMTLLAAFQTLLYRYTGQDDIAVGTPVANRNRADVEDLIGFFVNTLVMRADLSGGTSFRELLRQVREVALGAYAHQDVPFEMLVDELRVERSLSHTPLFQVAFALQGALLEDLQLSDLALSQMEVESGTAKFEMTLFMEDRANGLVGMLEYNTDLFEATTIERLTGHYQALLEGIVADPDQSIAALPMLTETERQRLLDEWSGIETVYPREQTIHGLFVGQVERTPDATAVICDENQLTYQELNRRANLLARHLQSLGVGPEVLVGIFMDRSLEAVVAHLAILKAGGAYLPLDTDYPQERLAFMMEDGQIPVILTQERMVAALPEHKAKAICLDTGWEAICAESGTDPASGVTADNLAYVMYTSGSTGRPKGISVVHRGVVRLVKTTNYADLTSDEVFLQLAPISFDASTLEIWGPLLNGGRLVVMPSQSPSLAEIGQALKRYQVTTLWLTASLFHLMVDERFEDLKHLEQLLAGGDVLSVSHVRRVVEGLGGVRMIDGYGPTENTTFSTCYPVKDPDRIRKSVPIGYPIANTRVYILDARLQPVPIGVTGELHIGGDGLARGYLARPKQTAERFIPNPYGDEPGARLYRTGDLARFLADGSIEFLGRVDFQVKIRGFRIELGEIKTVLDRHPGLRDVVVLAREDTPGDKRLVAYVIPEEDALSAGDLRRFLKRKLPEYMVPSAFVFLDAFPVSPVGKVDRRALPVPDVTRRDLGKAYVAPRTAVERFLVERWQDVLGIERIGIHDNFFELGGDSLQAAVLINRLQEELDGTTHVKALFMAPTVADLARYMIEYYPDAVAKIDETAASEEPAFDFEAEIPASGQVERVTVSTVKQMRQLIPSLPPREDDRGPASKNPPATFILSPPRSGSTLFRTMLTGHPRLFAPPELDLLSFNRLNERREAFTGKRSFWLQGPIHAIMELKGCGPEEAAQLMDDFERRQLTVKEFYALLQKWMGERMLVDKTPTYPLDRAILQRMEADFEGARYIHLTRHPYATIYSFVEAKLDEVFFRYEHPFSQRVLAELVWILSHQNILEFFRSVPAKRQHRLAFEDLVRQPEAAMRRVCQFLDIDFHPALVSPYDGDRMTKGIRPGEQMVGDFKFYLRKEIDPSAADRWKRFHTVDFLSDIGGEVAESLGYARTIGAETGIVRRQVQREVPKTRIRPITRNGDLPLSYAQQRLWFLDQFEPESPFYNIPSAVRLIGELDAVALRRSLNEIASRHEVLRTTFHTVDGKATQVIAPELTVPLPLVDLTGLASHNRESEARRLAAEDARRSFDLSQGPLVRASLIRFDAHEHVILLNMHHIVSDGWSVGVLVREMAALYEAFSQGRPSPLPELPIQYVDYARWQREWLAGEVLEDQLAYWMDRLGDGPAVLELPMDRPRPAVQTLEGNTVWFDLPETLSDQIKALSRREKSSLYMTLLAAFQALLHRYTGQEDISVGTPIANRQQAEIEALIGFFVNTLVMRTDLGGDPSFRELLKRVHKMAVQAYAHQDVPFEMLVDELEPERDMSHTPLFQVMFTIQDAPVRALEVPGLKLHPMRIDSGTAKFDLTLSMIDRPEGLRGSLEYNTDLFDEGTVERMAGHYEILLKGIVADPDRPIGWLPLLPDEEREQLLVAWNDTALPYASETTIPRLFERQVERTPEAVAVVSGVDSLTYQELDRRANQLAHHLRRPGVGLESVVGLCVERSVGMLVGLMGILKAGAAYLPLDPAYPEKRLQFMLGDARVPVMVTEASLMGVLPGEGLEAVCLDADWPAIAQESEEAPGSGIGPENLAYVIYTSGSTGQPKGAMVEHRSALHLAGALREEIYRNLPGMPLRLSLNAPLPFDASVQQWVMLTQGHTLHIVPERARLDGQALLAFVRENQLDVLDCVPTQLKLLLEAGLLDGNGWVPSAVLPGGEAIDEATWGVLRRANRTEFYNMYGPSECAVDSTIARLKEAGGRPTIGGPVPNAQAYVLDEHLEPMPMGVAGELHIGGAGVGRGYLNRPGLTAERFIPDPFAASWGAGIGEEGGNPRLYRTGDLVRYRPDGEIEFLGRIDHQVKVRGFRIELGEVETVLSEHRDVKEVVALAREDTPGEKRLVAYLVLRDGAGMDAEGLTVTELRRYLKARVPEYMLPSAFVTLDELPLLPNGKVDRRGLPAPDEMRPELEAAYVAPRTERERILAAIWSEVLGLEQVGVHDNFFELGGDSILSIQVISRANQAGLKLMPRQLFEQPTVAGLAAVAGVGRVVEAQQGVVEGRLPLTPIQQRFFGQDLPEPHHWNQAFLLEVREELQPEPLEEAVGQLLMHHDALRLRFERGEGSWRQVNAGVDREVPFEWVDLSGLPEAEQGAVLEARAAELQASLDLGEGPLMRIAYFDLGNGRPGRLLMVIHHLVVDGVSWRILMEDLQTAYAQLSQGARVQLPAKTTSFRTWARRLMEHAQTEGVREELTHWLAVGQGGAGQLPIDDPDGANTEALARSVRVSLSAELTQALLQDVPAAYGTEINDALLTALAQAVGGWAGMRRVLVDLEGHGREDILDDVDLSRTVGWFTTIYPVSLDLEGVERPGEALKAVKETLRRVPNRGIGYGLLRYLCEDEGVAEKLKALPQPAISFNYLGQVDTLLDASSPFALAHESPGPSRSSQGQRPHLLSVNGSITGGQLLLEWIYSEDLHRRATIERLAADFLEALRGLIAHCRSPDAGGYTPSDFADVDLRDEEIEALMAEIGEAV